MGNEIINIGGVQYRSNVVKDYSEHCLSKNTNTKVYSVFLDDGTRLIYGEQKATSGYQKPSVAKVLVPQSTVSGYSINNIKGLHLIGTSEPVDYYELKDCPKYNVDIKDGNADLVTISASSEDIDVEDGVVIKDSVDRVLKFPADYDFFDFLDE